MALFTTNPPPHAFEWTTQWKTWLSNLWKTLTDFLVDPEFSSVITTTLIAEGDALVEGTLQVEGDLSAQDAGFSGEVTVGNNLNVGGTIVSGGSAVGFSYDSGLVTTSGLTGYSFPVPPYTKSFTVQINALSTSSTNIPRIQLWASGAAETSGYNGATDSLANAAPVSISNYTTGVLFAAASHLAANLYYGEIKFTKMSDATNLWSFSGQLSEGGTETHHMVGTKALAATISHVGITINGVDTFDGGTWGVKFLFI